MDLIISDEQWCIFKVRVPIITTAMKIIHQCLNLDQKPELNGRGSKEELIELADMTFAEIRLHTKEKVLPAEVSRCAKEKHWQVAGTKATAAFICDISQGLPNLMADSLISDFERETEDDHWTFLQFARCGSVQHARFILRIGHLNELNGQQHVLLIRSPTDDDDDNEDEKRQKE